MVRNFSALLDGYKILVKLEYCNTPRPEEGRLLLKGQGLVLIAPFRGEKGSLDIRLRVFSIKRYTTGAYSIEPKKYDERLPVVLP